MAQKDTSWMRAKELVRFLKEGDLIEFDLGLFKHWGVFVKYCPQDRIYYVVHLSGDLTDELLFASSSSSSKGEKSVGKSLGDSLQFGGKAVVQMDNLMELVAAGGLCRVNNGRDTDFIPFPPKSIVDRAMGALNKARYDALDANCEHFATWCRYDTKQSHQCREQNRVANVENKIEPLSVKTALTAIGYGIGVGVAGWAANNGVVQATVACTGSWLGYRVLKKLGW